MALTYGLTYTLTDDSGDSATFNLSLPTAFSLAQFTEFGRAMAVFVDDVVSGLISRCELSIGVDISSLTGNTAAAGGDVQEINSYQFVTAVGRPVNINIPGTDETDVSPNSDELNTVDAQQAAFITAVVSGIAVTSGTITVTDIDSEDVTALVYAREAARASGKRR
jgi:hypothetical protein